MRIITQGGMKDIPYESVMVYVAYHMPTQIFASPIINTNDELPLGTYKSEEDALYVMDCIRYSKMKGYDYFFMPSADSVPVWRQENRKVASYDT